MVLHIQIFEAHHFRVFFFVDLSRTAKIKLLETFQLNCSGVRDIHTSEPMEYPTYLALHRQSVYPKKKKTLPSISPDVIIKRF